MSGQADPVVEIVPLDKVALDPENVRIHPERNRESIRSSLQRFGAGRSIVLNKGRVIAGNGTVQEARGAGFSEVVVVRPKPGQLVAVERSEWTPQEAKAYGIADNQIATQAEWDDKALAAQLESLRSEDFNLDAVGFTDGEVDALLDRLAREATDVSDGAKHEDEFHRQLGVLVECKSESEQREVFEELAAQGLKCRVLTL